MATDSVRVVTQHYYWKPVWSVFRIFEVEEYARAGVSFASPVMDLGCGDGVFASMLRDRGLLDIIDVGLDYCIRDLSEVKQKEMTAVQGDIRTLPLKTNAMKSVFANGVLGSLKANDEADLNRVMAEVHRILSEHGLFVLTVPTRCFDKNLVIPQFYRSIGASWLASQYLRRSNRGLTHYWIFDENEWRKKLQEACFRVEQVRYYFTPHQARWWTLLSLQIFRVFAVSKLLGVRWLKQGAAFLQQKMFQRIFVAEQSLPQEDKRERAGFLLIVARKASCCKSASKANRRLTKKI
jgi:SAM-dependent methyltransferase